MKLPTPHKDYSLADVPSGGISLFKKAEGDVKASDILTGIKRPSKKHKRRGPQVKPLKSLEDLSQVLDNSAVTATLVKEVKNMPYKGSYLSTCERPVFITKYHLLEDGKIQWYEWLKIGLTPNQIFNWFAKYWVLVDLRLKQFHQDCKILQDPIPPLRPSPPIQFKDPP